MQHENRFYSQQTGLRDVFFFFIQLKCLFVVDCLQCSEGRQAVETFPVFEVVRIIYNNKLNISNIKIKSNLIRLIVKKLLTLSVIK
jgi:hypothetical protein